MAVGAPSRVRWREGIRRQERDQKEQQDQMRRAQRGDVDLEAVGAQTHRLFPQLGEPACRSGAVAAGATSARHGRALAGARTPVSHEAVRGAAAVDEEGDCPAEQRGGPVKGGREARVGKAAGGAPPPRRCSRRRRSRGRCAAPRRGAAGTAPSRPCPAAAARTRGIEATTHAAVAAAAYAQRRVRHAGAGVRGDDDEELAPATISEAAAGAADACVLQLQNGPFVSRATWSPASPPPPRRRAGGRRVAMGCDVGSD